MNHVEWLYIRAQYKIYIMQIIQLKTSLMTMKPHLWINLSDRNHRWRWHFIEFQHHIFNAIVNWCITHFTGINKSSFIDDYQWLPFNILHESTNYASTLAIWTKAFNYSQLISANLLFPLTEFHHFIWL